MPQQFDRSAEDLGNAIHLEHINVQIPDQRLATLFYVTGLGLTRDPYLMVSDTNMWINAGQSQFHLPSGKPQVLRGHVGLVIEGRNALLQRLASVGLGRREEDEHPKTVAPRQLPTPQSRGSAPRRDAREPTAEDGNPISEYAKRHPAPRPAPQGIDPHGRPVPAPATMDEEHLEIPAFLRRQAN